jgi:hypothetical protein
MNRSGEATIETAPDYGRYWDRGMSWNDFLEREVKKNAQLWRGVYDTHRTPEWAVRQAMASGASRRLLVIAEDWCGDASNTVPVIARLAESVPNLEMRIVRRDNNPELMGRHLTDGSRSIPVVIVLDPDARPLGHWAPRPAELQEWVLNERRAGTRSSREIYRETRRWYALDGGESTLRELLALVSGTVVGGRGGSHPEETSDGDAIQG